MSVAITDFKYDFNPLQVGNGRTSVALGSSIEIRNGGRKDLNKNLTFEKVVKNVVKISFNNSLDFVRQLTFSLSFNDIQVTERNMLGNVYEKSVDREVKSESSLARSLMSR